MYLKIKEICDKNSIKLTKNRNIIIKIISESKKHINIEELLYKANKVNKKIGIATIYRTLKLLESCGAIVKHEFGDSAKALYEIADQDGHHDHLIDVETGDVHEFYNLELENLKEKIARDMGYELINHKLELYCRPIKK